MLRRTASVALLGVAAAAAITLWCVILGAERVYEGLEKGAK